MNWTGNNIAQSIDDSENFTDVKTDFCGKCGGEFHLDELEPVTTNHGSFKYYLCSECEENN